MKRIKVLHVNHETLGMFGAASEKELLANLDKIFRDEMRGHFRSELLTFELLVQDRRHLARVIRAVRVMPEVMKVTRSLA